MKRATGKTWKTCDDDSDCSQGPVASRVQACRVSAYATDRLARRDLEGLQGTPPCTKRRSPGMVRTSPRFDGAEAQQETARTPRSGNLGKLARVPKRKPGRFRARGRLGNRTLFEQPSLERSDSLPRSVRAAHRRSRCRAPP